jgi:hypothetical protein
MHAVKRRAGNEFGDFICLRRYIDATKDCRYDSRIQCNPARHDAASRFFISGEYSSASAVWQTKLAAMDGTGGHKKDMPRKRPAAQERGQFNTGEF